MALPSTSYIVEIWGTLPSVPTGRLLKVLAVSRVASPAMAIAGRVMPAASSPATTVSKTICPMAPYIAPARRQVFCTGPGYAASAVTSQPRRIRDQRERISRLHAADGGRSRQVELQHGPSHRPEKLRSVATCGLCVYSPCGLFRKWTRWGLALRA